MEDVISLSDAVASPRQGHNRLQALINSATIHGGQAALGVTALPTLALEVMEASHEGWIRPESALQIAQSYADGCKKAGGTPGSVKTNASKLRKLMELGKLNDGLKIAKEALRLRNETEKPKSPFETLVEVARHCVKSKSCELAEDEIKAVIARQAPKEKPKGSTKQEVAQEQVTEAQFTGWQSVAVQVHELMVVKDEDGLRYAHAIRAQLDNYLRDDGAEADADEAADPPPDAPSAPEGVKLDEAAQTPPAVNLEEEENIPGDKHDQRSQYWGPR